MSELITNNIPIEPENYDPESYIETEQIPLTEAEFDEESDTLDLVDLDLEYGTEVAVLDPEEIERQAIIDYDTVESLHAHDNGVVKRYEDVETVGQTSARQNKQLKEQAQALGKEIRTEAGQRAEANRQQILDAMALMQQAGQLALSAVERKMAAELANGESIEEASGRLFMAAAEILNRLKNDSLAGQAKQQLRAELRDNAIATKNERVQKIEEQTSKVHELRQKIAAAEEKIRSEYEPSNVRIVMEKAKIIHTENTLLRPLQPSIVAIMNERFNTDMTDDYDDPEEFRDKMRAVYEDLGQTDIEQSGGITPEDVYRAAAHNDIKPDQWFMLQRERRKLLVNEDHLQRLIDRERSHIAYAQVMIAKLNEGIALLEEDRDHQHNVYKQQEHNEGALVDFHSTVLKDVAETVGNILYGDASSITEAAIVAKFGYSAEARHKQLPENSLAAKLIDLLRLKRRLQQLIRDAEDAGDDLPIMPEFTMSDLPALEIDGESAIDLATEHADNVDKLVEKMKPFRDPLHDLVDQVSLSGIKEVVRAKTRGIFKDGIRHVFSNQGEDKEE